MKRNGPLELLLEESLPFWEKISDAEKKAVIENTSDIMYEKGACLNGSDDSCAGVFLVRRGTLRVYMLSDEGKDLTLFDLVTPCGLPGVTATSLHRETGDESISMTLAKLSGSDLVHEFIKVAYTSHTESCVYSSDAGYA